MSQGKVMVTGASGYIGSWITKTLLDQGYTVHATVRDLSNEAKVSHLHGLADGTSGEIKLFEANLLQEGSFFSAMDGCDDVIHSASPFIVGKIKKPKAQLIDPALKGTNNVLGTAKKIKSVKRVVLTSSVVAMYGDAADIVNTLDGVVNEACWNETSSETHRPYSYSKTIAEKEAWKLANGAHWDLAIINPGFVMGPSLSKRTDGASVDVMLSLLSGKYKMGVPDLNFALVDVRDVASAHVRALTSKSTGRFLTAGSTGGFLTMAQEIERLYPGKYPLPKRLLPKAALYLGGPAQGFSWKFVSRNVGYPMKIDNSRIKELLGMDFKPLSMTLGDHVEQVEHDGLLVKA